MTEGREAGFTLVEMIVCLALASLIGLLMLGTIRAAGNASAAAAFSAEAEEVQSVRDHLRRTLGALARRRIDGSGPGLQGRPDGLLAGLGADRSLERGADLAVSLASAPREDGGFDLIESRAPLEPEPGTVPRRQSEVLLEGVAGVSLRYFGATAENAPPAWQPVWLRTDRMPILIEIGIAFGPRDRRRWPPLLVALGERPRDGAE